MPETEADTCRKYVLPKLYSAGWEDEQINEQHSFTDGRIVPGTKRIRRRKQKRADYRLRVTRDFPIAIVEAKVLADGSIGMIEASITRRFSTPWTRSSSSTTDRPSVAGPMRHVPTK